MGRRSRFLLILLGGMVLFGTANSAWNSWRDRPLEVGPPTPKPAANFVPVRPAGDVPMSLRATSADGSAFTSSVIVTGGGHPSAVAYLAAWRQGANLRIGSLDLASGKPLFPVVDLGAWKEVYQLAARPEGILVAGLQTKSRPQPALPGAPDQLEVHFVALDPSTGRVRWQDRVQFGGQLPARLYPYGVLAANEMGVPALLDWTTGAPRWTLPPSPSEPSSIDNALPAVAWVEPRVTAPLAAAAELDTSTPEDPRLAVRLNGSVWILDAHSGHWTSVSNALAPWSTSSAASVLVIGQSVYLSATIGRSGDVLYRFPADPPRPVDKGDSLWGDTASILATTPCGSDRLCLTEGRTSGQTGQLVLVDTGSRRKRALPDTVPTGGYAIGDRYVDPTGRVYDLTGALLGESSPLASAWWLTPGSLVGIDRGNPAGTVGVAPHATIVAVSTVDGRRTVLGQLPAVPLQVTTGNGYLVYAADDGFHALQYAQP